MAITHLLQTQVHHIVLDNGAPYAAYPVGGYAGLIAGTPHTVSEKNAAGCNSVDASITINAAPGAPVAPTLTEVDPTCATNTGGITLVANAGSLYSLDGAPYAAYPVGGYAGLLARNTAHTVSEKNAAGCNSVDPASITINTAPGAPAPPTLTEVDPTCATNTGGITLVANAGSLYSLDGAPYAAYPAAGYAGLLPGTPHTVSAQNAAGCNSVDATININAAPGAPAAPTLTEVDPTLRN